MLAAAEAKQKRKQLLEEQEAKERMTRLTSQ